MRASLIAFALGFGALTSQAGELRSGKSAISNSSLDSSSVTLQGNIFNTASKLVQLNSTGQLPQVASTSSLLSGQSWLPAQLPSTAAYTNKDNNFSTTQTFPSSVTVLSSLGVSSAAIPSNVYLAVEGSTLAVYKNGVITAPSQPFASVSLAANQSFADSTEQNIFWDTILSNVQGMFVIASSDTITTTAAGVYFISCSLMWDNNATGARLLRIRVGGANVANSQIDANATIDMQQALSHVRSIGAGVAIACRGNQGSGGQLNAIGDSSYSRLEVIKLW